MHYSTKQEISRLINNKGKEVGIEILKGERVHSVFTRSYIIIIIIIIKPS